MERAPRTRRGLWPISGAIILALTASPVWAQQEDPLTQEAFLSPPTPIAEAVRAPRHENVQLRNLDPSGRRFLKTLRDGLPSLADFARPHYNLGGLQIDPAASRARSMTTRPATGFEIIRWEDGRSVHVNVPRRARVSSPSWSPDGTRLAFYVHSEDATHIHVADVETGRAHQVTRSPVLATLVTSIQWTADGRIVTVLVPDDRGEEPVPPAVPSEPGVRLTSEGENKLRTYASLLESPHDIALLEHFTTGQLTVVDPESRQARKVGEPARIQSVSPSPSGEHFLVTTIQEPFSYIVPVNNFGTARELWDASGTVLHTLHERPLNEGVRDERRDDDDDDDDRRLIAWRPNGDGLSFLQREPERESDDDEEEDRGARKDRVMQWKPPFDSTSLHVVYESERKINSVRYADDARVLFLTERSSGRVHLYAIDLDEPEERYTIVRHRVRDFFEDPGTMMTTRNELGRSVIRTSSDGSAVYLSGTQYSEDPLEEAPRPFVDRFEIRTGETERVFESDTESFEQVLAVLDDDLERLIISRESATQVPNSYLLDRQSGETRQLTQNRDHTPDITAARREVFEVTRVDGIKFRVQITLPSDDREGTRLPALFWFYPREYADQEAYDRSNRTYNKNRFPSLGPRSMEILIREGYAVVQPDAPIIGPNGQMNDNYVPDLRNNLAAVIDELDRRGYIDRDRLGLGGHSYGAFSTVNAMVHTPFFKAGIAGNGNYNRTLTPIGFQRERREFWEARERYIEMSPFMWAERLNGALLMYHGTEDQNVGTHPINSERLFHALNGLGKTAALYMYPYEDHGPATEETLLDLWARWVAWLDRYVKNAGEEPSAADVAASADEAV